MYLSIDLVLIVNEPVLDRLSLDKLSQKVHKYS
jgi:hypothetical protein